MRTKAWIGALALLAWGGMAPVFAAPLTTGADFLLMPVGARPDGMGQAFSAVADDLYALSFNPAGLGGISRPEIGYGRTDFVAGLHYDFLGLALPLGDPGVFGLGYVSLGTDPFNSTADTSAPLVSSSDTALLAAWGKTLLPFQLGAAFKYIDRQIAGTHGTGFAFDAGLRFIPPGLDQLTLSASVLNLGPGVQFASSEPLPTVFDGGAAWRVLNQTAHSLTLAGDYVSNQASQTQEYRLGLEYWFQGMLAGRAGYVFNSTVEGPSAGFGFKTDFLELDYSYQPYDNLGSANRFSGLLRWDGPWMGLGQLAPPRGVSVQPTEKGFQVSWQAADRLAQGYEVVVKPLGGPEWVSKPVASTSFSFEDGASHQLCGVRVRAIGDGGARSGFSQPAYGFSGGVAAESLQGLKITGRVDRIGLNLEWATAESSHVSGYHLYRFSPSGLVARQTLAPKKTGRVWITNVQGLEGWRWIVTAVNADDGTEKILGSYLWNPSAQEVRLLSQSPALKLHAEAADNQQISLSWDADPQAQSYSVLYSSQPDGVFELYWEVKDLTPSALLQLVQKVKEMHFMVAASKENLWISRTNESKVSLDSNP